MMHQNAKVIRLSRIQQPFPISAHDIRLSARITRNITGSQGTPLTEGAAALCHNDCGGIATVVYVDVLLFINTVVTYAVLITAEKLIKRDAKPIRLIAAAMIGSLFSLVIFIGINSVLFSFVVKAVSSLLLSAVAFRFASLREYLKNTIACIGVSVAYSGVFFLIYQHFKPPNMVVINDVPYFEFNPLILLGSTAVIYLLLTLFHKLFRERIKSTVVRLRFTVNSQEYSCVAKVDTGCNLAEPFSGAPVIIADEKVFRIPDDLPKRVIPYTSVGSASILYAVKADRIVIDGAPIDKTVYIASSPIGDDHIEAIINSEILR